ncbi:MAG: phosphotransferase [Phycisphaerae bacterium]
MDDRTAYLLNGLVERHYDIGRVLRFRKITRGQQAECFEILTVGQREFLLLLFPATFDTAVLQSSGALTARLGEAGFPVAKALHASSPETQWVAAGPQGSHLMISTQPAGQALAVTGWSLQDLSHLGLRLAWLHRLLSQERPAKAVTARELAQRLQCLLAHPAPGYDVVKRALKAEQIEKLIQQLTDISVECTTYRHGALTPDAVLTDADHQIVSVLDWGYCQAGFAHEDVVDVFLNWCVDNDGQIRSPEAQAFLQAYFSLHSISDPGWHQTVLVWTGHRLIAALSGCARLPRGFATILENPHFLSAAITICQSKL